MTKNTIAVTVGRFQTASLSVAHLALLNKMAEHQRMVILVGTTVVRGTKKNMLDFETRRLMLQESFPKALILPLPDIATDDAWSRSIDNLLSTVFPYQKFSLYGGRDSWLPHYVGNHTDKIELTEIPNCAATELREAIAFLPKATPDFRTGVIYGAMNNWPKAWQAVDIAIEDENKQVLMAYNHTSYKFPGGFVDPTDASLEAAAKREALEECGDIEIADPKYIGSTKIDDWRYRNEDEKVITALFSFKFLYGSPKPSDDLVGLQLVWVKKDLANLFKIAPSHKPLFSMLLKNGSSN